MDPLSELQSLHPSEFAVAFQVTQQPSLGEPGAPGGSLTLGLRVEESLSEDHAADTLFEVPCGLTWPYMAYGE